ncbi:MAG: hypothetical protein JW951_00125 [Lentisphaerae bacterium]|nr:hypothetical protein [Lentisphaerota bacterium]
MKSWINIITGIVVVVVGALVVVALVDGMRRRTEAGAPEPGPGATAAPCATGAPPAEAVAGAFTGTHHAGAAGMATGAPPAEAALPIEQLQLPVEFYPDGALKSRITAAFARVPDEGDIDGTDVRFELYAQTGATNLVVEAENCRFDRERGVATSAARVWLEKPDVAISGTGFEWNISNEVVRLLGDVKVIMQRSLRARREGGGG